MAVGETPGGARQLPLDFGHEPHFSREHFVRSAANAAALDAVDRWPDWPSPVTVLAGPPGSGKSHLAAIWAGRASAAGFAADSLEADAVAAMTAGPVLVEDAGPDALDETGLFHLINEARGTGHGLLVTSRSFPAAWRVTLPDLASRLKAATIVEIGEPDDALLKAVMTKLFADRQVEVEPHVVDYLIARIERSLSTASRVVERLDAMALEKKTRISRALAAQAVSALDEGQAELDL